VNTFTGCSHGCHYCFAQYLEGYRKDPDAGFFSEISLKVNIAELLDRELSKPAWNGKLINLGGVTDAYQPGEEENGVMREVWKVLIRHRTPVTLSTKSDLILRDLDLIGRLASLTFVNIASTIITADEELARKIEPGAASPASRFGFLKSFKKETVAITGVHVMPVIPLLTDSEEDLIHLFSETASAGADYSVEFPLHLKGRTRKHFLDFMRREFPSVFRSFLSLYRDSYLITEYGLPMQEKIGRIKSRFPLGNGYMDIYYREVRQGPVQLELF
jgi:DNA repair photolyase